MGAAKRHPDIKWIFCHAGGAAAPMIDRLVRQAANTREVRETIPEGPMPYLGRFYFDIATSASPDNLGVLMRYVPASQILFGLDLPFVPPESTLDHFGKSELGADVIAAIEHGNALRLFQSLSAA